MRMMTTMLVFLFSAYFFSINSFATCKLSRKSHQIIKNWPINIQQKVSTNHNLELYQELIWLLQRVDGRIRDREVVIREYERCLDVIMRSDYVVVEELSGITRPKLIRFNHSKVMGVLKKSDRYSKVEAEVAAYEMGRHWGLNFIPKTILVNKKNNSIQYFVKNLIKIKDKKMPLRGTLMRDYLYMMVFDFLTTNFDRHNGNYFILKLAGKEMQMLVGIDHGLLWRKEWFDLYDPGTLLLWKKFIKDHQTDLPPKLKRQIVKVDWGMIVKLLNQGGINYRSPVILNRMITELKTILK